MCVLTQCVADANTRHGNWGSRKFNLKKEKKENASCTFTVRPPFFWLGQNEQGKQERVAAEREPPSRLSTAAVKQRQRPPGATERATAPHASPGFNFPRPAGTYVLGVALVHRGQWRSGRHLAGFAGRSAAMQAGLGLG